MSKHSQPDAPNMFTNTDLDDASLDDAIDPFALDSDTDPLGASGADATPETADVATTDPTTADTPAVNPDPTNPAPRALDACFLHESGRTYLKVELDPLLFGSAEQFAREANENLAAALGALVRTDVKNRDTRRKELETEIQAHKRTAFKEAAKAFKPSSKRTSNKKKKVEQIEQTEKETSAQT